MHPFHTVFAMTLWLALTCFAPNDGSAQTYSYDEKKVGDFSADASTTLGIVEDVPNVGARAVGTMPKGDVDVVRLGLGEDTGVLITFNPCSINARARFMDATGNELAVLDSIKSGYSGLYAQQRLSELKAGLYIVEITNTGDDCNPAALSPGQWIFEFEPGRFLVNPDDFAKPQPAAATAPVSGAVTSTVPDQIGEVIMDNWNKGGCGTTDTILFSLPSGRDIGLARTWINWPKGETDIPYDLRRNGTTVLEGNFGRNSCDSFQQSWCEGVATWNTHLPSGQYSIKTGLARVCQNGGSDGNGFLALYETARPLVVQPSPAAALPTSTPTLASAGEVTSTVPEQLGVVIMDNTNKGFCRTTDEIKFSLASGRDIGLVQTWIKWPKDVTHVGYNLQRDGTEILKGNFGRHSCDTYQRSWCQGVATWNTHLSAGKYVITTDIAKVCKNRASKNNGFLTLYETAQPVTAAETPKPAISSTQTPTQATSPSSDFAIGDFSQRRGPFTHDESDVGDFTNVFATTQGIIEKHPSGAVNASGTAAPGDVDVVLVGLGEDGDITMSIRPCSRSGRLRMYDIKGNKLAESGEISYGYYGLYDSIDVAGLKKGAYAFVVDYPDGSECDDGNDWIVDYSGHLVDPIEFVGPFETKPDFSVREDLNVDDLIEDLSVIMRAD